MTKEQIGEKLIETFNNRQVKFLASYLATIEERLEKVEGKTPKFIKRTDGLTEIEYYPTPTEVKEEGVCGGEMVRCKECDTVYCNGCWKQCFQCHPIMTVPKDDNKKWEIEFDKRFVLTSYDGLDFLPCLHGTPAEIKSFIRNLLNK